MRRFQRLSQTEDDNLNKLFPDLDKLYGIEDTNHYNHLAISVFDHILNEDEARDHIDGVTSEQETLNDRNLHEFCCSLALKNECYIVRPIGIRKHNVTYRRFLSHAGVKSYLEPKPYNWGSRNRFVLALPKMKLIYFEGWDFTHHVYYKDKTQISQLKEQAKEHGVFILE